ncbi:hypothetical protein [Nocardioides sp. KR10-350]|uniref:hypothetical protein n=1 Tax=Nocardioides cheoyonin TaxID=3156615 RepID=UPI0032B5135F
MTLAPTGPTAHRVFGRLPSFDPDQAEIVLEPEKPGNGYWVGCPSVLHDEAQGVYWLTYRRRRPRGEDADRGWRCAVAKSTDGLHFQDVWSVEKQELETTSMERFSLLPAPDGGYLLYLSYVDPADNRWRIDVIEAERPEELDVRKTAPALTAESTGTEGVKDPYTLRIGPAVYLFASYASGGLSDEDLQRGHANADIYNTGVTTHPTGLATSLDGRTFAWQGPVFDVGSGWDRYQARLNTVLPLGGAYLSMYDGSGDVTENYEERTGLAISHDLRQWHSLTPDRPWITSPYATGSLRYFDAVPQDGETWLYFEFARPDGSHDLRRTRIAH